MIGNRRLKKLIGDHGVVEFIKECSTCVEFSHMRYLDYPHIAFLNRYLLYGVSPEEMRIRRKQKQLALSKSAKKKIEEIRHSGGPDEDDFMDFFEWIIDTGYRYRPTSVTSSHPSPSECHSKGTDNEHKDSNARAESSVMGVPGSEPVADYWKHQAVITPNNFKFKSLSNWSFNVAVGCSHGCGFCYVPSTSTTKLAETLLNYGVWDPDAEWGQYVLLRHWNEEAFLKSLRRAQECPNDELRADGNRAVIYCSTTDAYQTIKHPDPVAQRKLQEDLRSMVRRSLELIRDHSDLNVRILTRSPLAKLDFDLYQTFGDRLLFGMSLPTLNNRLARIYEPSAPSPAQRLKTLRAAKEAGIHIFVAVAPTYPECDEDDLRRTLTAVRDLDPVTVFHEPINIRADNVARIEKQAAAAGVTLRTEVFETRTRWRAYANDALRTVETIAKDLGISDHLHLWPDVNLGTKVALKEVDDPVGQQEWLQQWWDRISEWPPGS